MQKNDLELKYALYIAVRAPEHAKVEDRAPPFFSDTWWCTRTHVMNEHNKNNWV